MDRLGPGRDSYGNKLLLVFQIMKGHAGPGDTPFFPGHSGPATKLSLTRD